MYWLLVVRPDLATTGPPPEAVRGRRIGAVPGVVDGLLIQMLRDVGSDPESDVDIGPIPATDGGGTSFGVAAAEALDAGTWMASGTEAVSGHFLKYEIAPSRGSLRALRRFTTLRSPRRRLRR